MTDLTSRSKVSCKQQVLLGCGTSGALPVAAIAVGPAKRQQVPFSSTVLQTAAERQKPEKAEAVR